VEVVALPADRRPKPVAPTADGRARQPGARKRGGQAQRLERAREAAFAALRAVSSYSEAHVELPVFFGHLSETVARAVGARRAAFWRLGPDRALTIQPQPYGFDPDSPIHDLLIRPPADGESIVEEIVFRDGLELTDSTAADLDAFWQASGLPGLRNSMAVSWKAGGRPIGALAVYDSRRGFSKDDVWVLHVVAMATGLVWQYREVEQELGSTVERLEQSAAARRLLLGNVAAGGDEARRRFASALHDDSLQLVTAAHLQLERTRIETDPERRARNLDQLATTICQVEDSLRRLLLEVSPQRVELPASLDEAIRARLDKLKSQTGIEPDIDLRLPAQVPKPIRSVVLTNVSEAVTNVEKHANATRIRVSVRAVDGGIMAVVADDGKGFVVAESMDFLGHLGLLAIRERAQLAGGKCRIESEPGAGTRLEFWVPMSL
jgi:signal transduction histidine kinase